MGSEAGGLRLFARRVMIMEKCEDLLPRYLRFIKGVVDASDLPLNISRQRLQQDAHITRMRKRLTTKVLDSITETQRKGARAIPRLSGPSSAARSRKASPPITITATESSRCCSSNPPTIRRSSLRSKTMSPA